MNVKGAIIRTVPTTSLLPSPLGGPIYPIVTAVLAHAGVPLATATVRHLT